MAHVKKITAALSVAATVLLESCGGSGSDSATGPVPVANTLAPELVASWQTDCIVTQNSGSTTTVTQASGGSGGGSISGGEAYRNSITFNPDGRVSFTTEYFATSNCNANTLAGVSRYNGVYYVGEATMANDGSPVTEIDFSDSSSTTYSIFQLVNSTTLYLGEAVASSPTNDGSTEAARYDGLGPRMSR